MVSAATVDWHVQQARMHVHVFQRGEQGSAIGCWVGSSSSYARGCHDNFTYTCPGDIPQLRDFYNINHRERDDRRRRV